MTLLANRHNNFFNDPFLLNPMELFNSFTTSNMNELVDYADRKLNSIATRLKDSPVSRVTHGVDVYHASTYTLKEGGTRYEYAMPGFSEENLKVKTYIDGNGKEHLTVEGNLDLSSDLVEVVNSTLTREVKFEKTIPSNRKVSNVKIENGILSIDLLEKEQEELTYIDWI